MQIYLCLVLLLFLAACTSGPTEGDIQTAIAQTEQARPSSTPTSTPEPTPTSSPSPTPTATITPTLPIDVELQIMSSLAQALTYEIWTIEWGVNGSVSTANYDYSDLEAHKFIGPGYRVHWSLTITAESGDTIRLAVTGFYTAQCLIIAPGPEITKALLSAPSFGATIPNTAVCQYTVP